MCVVSAATCDHMLSTERPHFKTGYLDTFMYTCGDVVFAMSNYWLAKNFVLMQIDSMLELCCRTSTFNSFLVVRDICHKWKLGVIF